MIAVTGLTMRYGDALAVDDLTFEVRPGLVTGCLGPNGAGKSTTMRVILGLETPDGGTALVGGRPYVSFRRPLREVGALLDAGAVHGGRTAAMHLRCLARSNRIGRERVGEVLEQVGLAEVADRRIAGFSLGMRQRLGIAAALLGDPGVLMFDEPINGLDLKVAAAADVISPGAAPDFPNWQRFARSVDRAAAGDASGFADLVEQVTKSLKVPSFRGQNVTHCTDGLVYAGYEEFQRLKELGERLSPNFAGNELWHRLGCVGWPSPIINPPAPMPADRLPPILGAGTWTDHADVATAAAGVPGSATIRYEGPGHALYLSGNQCTISHANRYLTYLRLPPAGTTCAPPPSS
ncbi:ATP-binding cassette domain-containing protein [Nonomuraea sp. B1E8]|uniref:ATP-binding cassette domain-containing protein n=1 Tax=unclassified Nonomuraea TaxID=2593643 RepID=UPI00325D62A4